MKTNLLNLKGMFTLFSYHPYKFWRYSCMPCLFVWLHVCRIKFLKGPKISDTMLGTQKILRIFLQPRSKNCGTVGFVPFAFLPEESCVKKLEFNCCVWIGYFMKTDLWEVSKLRNFLVEKSFCKFFLRNTLFNTRIKAVTNFCKKQMCFTQFSFDISIFVLSSKPFFPRFFEISAQIGFQILRVLWQTTHKKWNCCKINHMWNFQMQYYVWSWERLLFV